MSTDIKFNKAQLSKTNQSDGFLGNMLGNSGKKKVVTGVAIPLAKDNLPGLVSKLASNETNKFERKTSGKEAVRARKWFKLFISNEGMNDIIKIIKSLEHSDVLIDGVTETVKHEIKNKKVNFLGLCWHFSLLH